MARIDSGSAARGGDQRVALHEIAAGVGHGDRARKVERCRCRARASRCGIGGEIAGHVLDELAAVGAEGRGEQHGGQVGPAAPERGDGVAGVRARKPGTTTTRARRAARAAAAAAASRRPAASTPSGAIDAGLVHVERRRRARRGAAVQREQRHRPELARRPQQIERVPVGMRVEALRAAEQRVGLAVLGGHDDDEAFVRAPAARSATNAAAAAKAATPLRTEPPSLRTWIWRAGVGEASRSRLQRAARAAWRSPRRRQRRRARRRAAPPRTGTSGASDGRRRRRFVADVAMPRCRRSRADPRPPRRRKSRRPDSRTNQAVSGVVTPTVTVSLDRWRDARLASPRRHRRAAVVAVTSGPAPGPMKSDLAPRRS